MLDCAALSNSNKAVNHRTSLPRRALTAALLLSVLLVQWVGLIHGIVHAPGPSGWHAAVEARSAADRPPAAGDASRADANAPFGAHDDQSQCRLFDQLAHADLAWQVPPMLLEPSSGADLAPAPMGGHMAAQAAGYLARGPPLRA